jgi:hypothetical protein
MLRKTTLALATSVALATLFATEGANAQAYAQHAKSITPRRIQTMGSVRA